MGLPLIWWGSVGLLNCFDKDIVLVRIRNSITLLLVNCINVIDKPNAIFCFRHTKYWPIRAVCCWLVMIKNNTK